MPLNRPVADFCIPVCGTSEVHKFLRNKPRNESIAVSMDPCFVLEVGIHYSESTSVSERE